MTTTSNIGCVESNLRQGEYSQTFEDRTNHIRVQVDLSTPVRYGNCYQLEEIEQISNNSYNLSSFNYQQFMKSKTILYQGTGATLVNQNNGPLIWLKNYRKYLLERNILNLGNVSPYVNAVIFGENKIDSYYQQLYGQTGIAPIFAISGMHIGIIYFGLMYQLSKMRVLEKNANRLVITMLIVYSVLAGGTVAINRALMMIIFKTLCKFNSKQAIISSAVISLLINPFNILSQGYYLSYIITYAIIVMPEQLYKNQKYGVIKFGYLLYLIAFPISYSFNYTYNLLAPISLLIITPIICFGLMPLALIATILPNPLIINLIDVVIYILNFYVRLADEFTITSGYITLGMWLIFYCLLYCIFCKHLVKRVIIPLILWFVAIGLDIDIDPQVTFIDVGQGDSALIEYNGKNILIDAGNNITNLRQELKYQGVSTIDAVFISHPHLDHYGAMEELAKYFSIKAVYELDNNQIIKGSTGLATNVQMTNIQVFPYYGVDENNRELVIRMEFDGVSILFPGDVEGESETYLVNNYCSKLNSDILKVPHHGSKTSSSQSFLDCVSAEYAVISSGRNNRYGHPDPEVVARLKHRAQVYNTQFDGEVIFEVKSGKLRVKKVH